MTINRDSQSAIAFTKDPKYHSRTKHIDVKYNFVRDIIAQEKVRVQYNSMHNASSNSYAEFYSQV